VLSFNKQVHHSRSSLGRRRGLHKISIQHMLQRTVNEYEQVNCVKNRKKREKEDGKNITERIPDK
jgi:hypothetical protein